MRLNAFKLFYLNLIWKQMLEKTYIGRMYFELWKFKNVVFPCRIVGTVVGQEFPVENAWEDEERKGRKQVVRSRSVSKAQKEPCQKRQRSHSLRLLLHVEFSALPVEESRMENRPLDGARTEALPRWLPLMGILFVKTPNVWKQIGVNWVGTPCLRFLSIWQQPRLETCWATTILKNFL